MLKRISGLLFVVLLVVSIFLSCQKKEPEQQPRVYFLEQVGKTQIVRLYADGFEELPLKQKLLAYYLCQAAIAGRDIDFDQNHRLGLEIRNLLEEILLHSEGIPAELHKKIAVYTKLFWANNSNYNLETGVKFTPQFSPEELIKAASIAWKNGAAFGVKNEGELKERLKKLEKQIFDAQFESFLTNKAPAQGEDIITGSANNLYYNVNLAEVEMLEEKNQLNSRVAKIDGKIVEQVYRAGNADIKPGLYAKELKEVIANLEEAIPYAEPPQQETLRRLIHYFKTGDLDDFRKYNISWVSDDPMVDTINGFIEVYLDARGVKAEYEGFVYFVDQKTTKMMKDIAKEAQYFEDHQPWDDKYKKKNIQVPVSNSISVLMAIGGGGPISPIGINLPNEQAIREQYGSKNVLLTNVIRARREAAGVRAIEEFALTSEEVELSKNYGALGSDVVVALHEIVGHGSGKMSPDLADEPSTYLKEYYSTLEEARADLAGLYHIWDSKLIEIGVIPSLKAAEAAYHGYARNDLLMLRRIKEGDKVEQDHMKGRHMIVTYLREVTKAIDTIEKDGKVYLKVVDMKKMKDGIAELLSKIMRIKAEGDYQGAKKLVDTYGLKINTDWRDQIIRRCEEINYPDNAALVMPRLSLVKDDTGKVVNVAIHYDEDFQTQMLRFSKKLK